MKKFHKKDMKKSNGLARIIVIVLGIILSALMFVYLYLNNYFINNISYPKLIMACIFGIVQILPFMVGVVFTVYEMFDLIISKIIYAPEFKEKDTLLLKFLRKVFPENNELLNSDSEKINFDEEEKHQDFMKNIRKGKNNEK